jgi:AcrR family transcriptional regulator
VAAPNPGRRAASSARTRAAILQAAREIVSAEGLSGAKVGAVANRAGVSRLTIYQHFGSRDGLLTTLAAGIRPAPSADQAEIRPVERLRRRVAEACAGWAADPTLFRRLPEAAAPTSSDADRELALSLAQADLLRPGCSVKEAEDVIGVLTSFGVFDRLHHDGRRSTSAVNEILLDLAGAILTPRPS